MKNVPKKHVSIFILLFLTAGVLFAGVENVNQSQRAVTSEYVNIAMFKTADGSSQYTPSYPPENLNDGDLNTIWGSDLSQPNDWFYTDLLGVTTVSHVTIHWYESYYAVKYQIYSSKNGKNWTLHHEITNGTGGSETYSIPADARFVGVYIIKRKSVAVGVKEFEVYKANRIELSLRVNIQDETSGQTEPVDTDMQILQDDVPIVESHLTAGYNDVTFPVDAHRYELLIKKSGYYAYRKILNQHDLYGLSQGPLDITLDKKTDQFRAESLHIESENAFQESYTGIGSFQSANLIIVDGRGYFSMIGANQEKYTDVYDMTNPLEPLFSGRIPLAADTYDVSEHYLFLLENGTINIYDITIVDSPELIHNIALPAKIEEFSIDTDFLFIGTRDEYGRKFLHICTLSGSDFTLNTIFEYESYTITNDTLYSQYREQISLYSLKNGGDFAEPYLSYDFSGFFQGSVLNNIHVSGNFLYFDYSYLKKVNRMRVCAHNIVGFELGPNYQNRKFDTELYHHSIIESQDFPTYKTNLTGIGRYLFTGYTTSPDPIFPCVWMFDAKDTSYPYTDTTPERIFKTPSMNIASYCNVLYFIGQKTYIVTD